MSKLKTANRRKPVIANYLTRAKALKKLQISLSEFRRLCILKGIYPREPKKRKGAASDQTYYHGRDILYIMHDPLLQKIRQLKIYKKKLTKLKGRHEKNLAKILVKRRPTLNLTHLLKERYPSLVDAVRDLDDCVSSLAMFASLPSNDNREISADAVSKSSQLLDHFHLYVIKMSALRKAFISIKGFYFQAELLGQLVTWLVPHQFTQTVPDEVDFRVLLTFLDFYQTHLKFVSFKLYALAGYLYPPKEDAEISNALRGAGGAGFHALFPVCLDNKSDNTTAESQSLGDEFAGNEEASKIQEQEKDGKAVKSLFEGLTFFVGREVPRGPISFVVQNCGGALGWQGEMSPIEEKSTEITHQIVDRPLQAGWTPPEGREVVQPQWVFDSFNARVLLPCGPYAPGKVPPPHLSPFVVDEKEGYVPAQRRVLDEIIAQKKGEQKKALSKSGEEEDNLDDGSDVDAAEKKEEEFNTELQKERKGVWFSEARESKSSQSPADQSEDAEVGLIKKKLTKKEKLAEEDKERRKVLMSGRHRYLYNKMERTRDKQSTQTSKLEDKRIKKQKSLKSAPKSK